MDLLNTNQTKLKEKQQLEAIIKQKKQVEHELITSYNPRKGHTLFEINKVTLEIKKAKFIENKTVSWYIAKKIEKGEHVDEVLINNNCVYISALNAKVAMKRYSKGKGSSNIPEGTFDLHKF